MVLNDLDINLTKEMLHQLDLEDSLTEDFGTLSLNAISGTDNGEVLQLRALVQNKIMLLLVDSGSSHCFISPKFLNAMTAYWGMIGFLSIVPLLTNGILNS